MAARRKITSNVALKVFMFLGRLARVEISGRGAGVARGLRRGLVLGEARGPGGVRSAGCRGMRKVWRGEAAKRRALVEKEGGGDRARGLGGGRRGGRDGEQPVRRGARGEVGSGAVVGLSAGVTALRGTGQPLPRAARAATLVPRGARSRGTPGTAPRRSDRSLRLPSHYLRGAEVPYRSRAISGNQYAN